MDPITVGRGRICRRVAASLAAVALAVAAPAALASSTSVREGVVHTYIDRSGTTVVSGYDGGVAIAVPNAQK